MLESRTKGTNVLVGHSGGELEVQWMCVSVWVGTALLVNFSHEQREALISRLHLLSMHM